MPGSSARIARETRSCASATDSKRTRKPARRRASSRACTCRPSALSPRDLQRAIALADKATVGRAQGIGPKLALRIVTELKDKAPAMMLRSGDEIASIVTAPRGPEADAVSALVKLGYSQGQAAEAIARAARDLGEAPADALIRDALRAMGRG